jgi:hypothetical protein
VDAGYSVGKAKGGRRSGLDVSKKSPTSLFYLPCQAKEASDSFFHDDDKRKMLNPMTWIENTVVPFPKVDDARRNAQQIPPKKVDQAAVEEATMIWRESKQYPGQGNTRFFNFAVSLRSAGMSIDNIELKLRDEATFGRTAEERRAQIPSIMRTLRASLKKTA